MPDDNLYIDRNMQYKFMHITNEIQINICLSSLEYDLSFICCVGGHILRLHAQLGAIYEVNAQVQIFRQRN
jgi:hypothetical protein